MRRVTLAQRLLLAIGLVTLATTTTLGFGVREAWRRTEEARFEEQFDSALARLKVQLAREISDLPRLLRERCEYDPALESILVDLRANRLDAGRRLAISQVVPKLMQGLALDELLLVTGSGEVLGAGHKHGLVGSRDPALGAKLAGQVERATLRNDPPPRALEAHCSLSMGSTRIGLYGARYFDSILAQVGATHGITLSLAPAHSAEPVLQRSVRLDELGGANVVASRSRIPLLRALSQLDVTVVLMGVATVLGASLLAVLLSRGLSRPIVALSRQAREVVAGEPKPVEGGGGKELVELADSFNRALLDLAALRKRLAATERIAARREIARRVAHEIKNPLAPIRAAVETLRRLRARNDPAFDEYFDEASRTVLDEVTRITHIVQEFTRFARLPPPNPTSLDLSQVVRDVVRLHEAAGTPITLDAGALPEVSADRDQMVQVVTNLLQNAIDAASARPSPRVWVSLRQVDAQHVGIAVRDNGPGVAPEMRQRLFEPYATSKEHGTGLGLAIVQRIVVEHGGDIQHADAAGGGAEFTVVLPIQGPTLLTEPPRSTGTLN